MTHFIRDTYNEPALVDLLYWRMVAELRGVDDPNSVFELRIVRVSDLTADNTRRNAARTGASLILLVLPAWALERTGVAESLLLAPVASALGITKVYPWIAHKVVLLFQTSEVDG